MKNNLRTFEVRYVGATNSRGARVQITDLLRNEKRIIAYDYKFNNVMDMAIEFLQNELKVEILYTSENQKGYLLHTDNFVTSIKK